jgi:hypothetical protein
MNKLKIGITGSKLCESKIKIKEFIFNLRKQHQGEIEIYSLGDQFGADKYIKRYALEFGYTYKELNPAHTNKNLYSVMGESWHGKPYTHKNAFLRDKIFSEMVDVAVVFEVDKKTENIIKQFHKLKKKIVVIG